MSGSSSNILALDIATKTGWATYIDNEIKSGVWDSSEYKDDGERASKFDDWLFWLLIDKEIDLMVAETAFSTGFGKVDYRLLGMQYLAHMCAWDNKVARKTVAPATLKKFTTGNGRAKKADMVAAVREWGFDPQDDNEADALALLTYAKEKLCQ